MARYVVKRIIQIPFLLLGIVFMTFLIVHLTPGDPAAVVAGSGATPEAIENIRVEMGLDQPLVVQFFDYLGGLLHGDMGDSLVKKTPVADSIQTAMVNTVYLVIIARLWSVIVGVFLGVLAAKYHNKLYDKLISALSIVGLSVPTFYIGLVCMYVFCFKLGWFPISGLKGTLFSAEGIQSMIVPAFVVGIAEVPSLINVTRSNMIDVLSKEYIRTAKAKGMSERVIIYKHALKNAAIPLITIIGMQTGFMLGGAVVAETIFAWPGIGRLAVDAILDRDYYMIQGCVLVIAFIFVIINFIVDLIYAAVDPRIKYD